MPSHEAVSFKIDVERMRERAMSHVILPESVVASVMVVIAAHSDPDHGKAIQSLCLSHERLRAELAGSVALADSRNDKQKEQGAIGVSLLKLLDEAQGAERALRRKLDARESQVKLLHDATIILRNALGGFRTVDQNFAYRDANRLLDEAAALEANEFVEGALDVFRKTGE